jgi:uncharacterized membrane protein
MSGRPMDSDPMLRTATIALALAVIVAATIVGATSGLLPPLVATHFGRNGAPNDLTPRGSYIALMLTLTVALPLALAAACAWIPRAAPRAVNLPDKAYWLAPPRRAATFATLTAFGCWLGAGSAVFCATLHLLLIETNAAAPPLLSALPHVTLLLGTVLAVTAWLALLLVRFRRIR